MLSAGARPARPSARRSSPSSRRAAAARACPARTCAGWAAGRWSPGPSTPAAAPAYVDAVYVSTDDDAIAAAAERAGAGVIRRPADLAGDTASSESALLHALDVLEQSRRASRHPRLRAVHQPVHRPGRPRPRRRAGPRAGSADVGVLRRGDVRVPLAAPGRDGLVAGRTTTPPPAPAPGPRAADYRETGALLRARRGRLPGRPAPLLRPDRRRRGARADARRRSTPRPTSRSPRPWPRCWTEPATDAGRRSGRRRGHHRLRRRAHRRPRATSTRADASRSGSAAPTASGVERLRPAGVPLLIVSKETNPVVRARAAKLGVEVLHGVEHKAEVVRDWLAAHGHRAGARRLPRQRPERPRRRWRRWAGRSPSPTRGRRCAGPPGWCSSRAGGDGAVRELCDLVLMRGPRAAAAGRAGEPRRHRQPEPAPQPTAQPRSRSEPAARPRPGRRAGASSRVQPVVRRRRGGSSSPPARPGRGARAGRRRRSASVPKQPEPSKTTLLSAGSTPKSDSSRTGRPSAIASSAAVEDTVTRPRARPRASPMEPPARRTSATPGDPPRRRALRAAPGRTRPPGGSAPPRRRPAA